MNCGGALLERRENVNPTGSAAVADSWWQGRHRIVSVQPMCHRKKNRGLMRPSEARNAIEISRCSCVQQNCRNARLAATIVFEANPVLAAFRGHRLCGTSRQRCDGTKRRSIARAWTSRQKCQPWALESGTIAAAAESACRWEGEARSRRKTQG